MNETKAVIQNLTQIHMMGARGFKVVCEELIRESSKK